MKKIAFWILSFLAVQVSAMEVELSCDALYWHTTETADWALIFPANTSSREYTFKTLRFDWDPGFRVAAGMQNARGFATKLSYTRFRPDTTNRAKEDQIRSEFFGGKLSLVGFFQEATFSAKIDYNIFDWELAYPLCPTDCLSFRPMIGLKGGWIDQTLTFKGKKTVDLFNILIFPVTATELLKNDFWGIGPQVGVSTNWSITNGFYLLGEASVALLWGHWSISDAFADSLNTRIVTKVADRDFGAWMVHGMLGLGYDFCWLKLQAGYEIQDWFNQYQIFDDGTGGHSNDLIFQGLTAGARLEF